MKKLLLFVLTLVSFVGAFTLCAYALEPDITYEFCVEKGYKYDIDDELGEVCVFPDDTMCPLDEFYNEECGTAYQNALECDSPYVPYQNECVDPLPTCDDFPEGAMFCVDKIENGKRIDRFNVTCYDGWDFVKATYDDFGELETLAYCKNPCKDPYIPIDDECVDPFPACGNPPENVMPSTCIDKIYYDGSVSENFEFQCMDGYKKSGFYCVLAETVFSDISGYKYQSAVEYVEENGIVDGYKDGTYRPDNLINRAEFTKIIVEALYSSDDFEDFADDSCFSDVLPNVWFTQYVCFAKEEGIINGYPDGTFNPSGNINYVEALKIVLEAYTQKGLMEDVDLLYTGAGLSSGGTFSIDWFYNYVKFAKDEGLSFSGEIENNQFITRGETAEIIMWIDDVTK